MSIEFESLKIINNLKQKTEAMLGKSYKDLTEAFQALIDGYGGSSEGGSGSSENFIGIRFLEFKDVDGNNIKQTLPTIADARSLDGNNMRPERMVYQLFDNAYGNNNGGMYAYLREVYMPSEPTNWSYTFARCFQLKSIHGNFEKLTTLHTTFDGCLALSEIPYMPNVTSVGANSFRDCVSLTSLKIYKKLTNFATNALNGCTNLTDIYVPWAEGEVANAPWGATNATIHYNTTYDENHNPIVEE